MNLRLKVSESLRWLVSAQLVSQLFRLSTSIYVIRQLENEHLAFVALANTIVGFVELFSSMGLGAVIVSKKDLTDRDIANIAGLVFLINILLMLLIFGSAGFFATLYVTPELRPILQALSFCFLLTAVSSIPSSLLTKQMRFKELSIVQVIASFAGALSSLVLVQLGAAYWSLVFGGIIFIFVRAAGAIVLNGGWVRPGFELSSSWQHLRFGGIVMTSGIFYYLYTSVDIALAGRFWSSEILGIYAVAVQLMVLPLNRLMPLLRQVALPAFSITVAQEPQDVQRYIIKSQRIAMAICFPFYLGISAVSVVFVPLVLGENWIDAGWVLTLLCLAAPFRMYLELLGPAVIASGNPKAVLLNTVVLAVLMTSSFVIALQVGNSPISLAIVWAVLYPPLSLFAGWHYFQSLGIKFWALVKSLFGVFISSVTMWVVVTLFISGVRFWLQDWSVFVLATGLGMCVYFALIWILDRSLIGEYKTLLARRNGSKS